MNEENKSNLELRMEEEVVRTNFLKKFREKIDSEYRSLSPKFVKDFGMEIKKQSKEKLERELSEKASKKCHYCKKGGADFVNLFNKEIVACKKCFKKPIMAEDKHLFESFEDWRYRIKSFNTSLNW